MPAPWWHFSLLAVSYFVLILFERQRQTGKPSHPQIHSSNVSQWSGLGQDQSWEPGSHSMFSLVQKKQHISVAYILQTLSNFKLSLCSIRFQQHTAKNRIKDEHLPNLCNNIYNIRYKYLVDWLPCSLMPVILPPRLMKQTLIYKFKGSLASSSS